MHTGRTKLVIANDHGILRQGLRRILEGEADMVVVGEALNGADVVKKTRQLKPDVVIMDITMPEQDGIESLRQILRSNAKVLILSAQLEQHIISEAVAEGASGYLAKETLDHELISAVRTIVHGGTVFSSNISRLLADFSRSGGGPSPRSLDDLTSREREVFLMLAEGKSPSETASLLFVSPKTVHTHRQHILEKLSLRTTTELIRFALRHGLIKSA